MATGDSFVHLYGKKIIGDVALQTKFFDYLKDKSADLISLVFGEGVFSAVAITGSAPDMFDLSALDGMDDQGRHLAAVAGNWSFENTNLQWYDVGFFYQEVPDQNIETNPRTGEFEYENTEEAIGDLGNPDSVTFPGPGLQFVVDTLLGGPGTSHAGRSATVWLTGKAATNVPATAFETVNITWSGTQNIVTITGTLGQSTPSLVAADYEVLVDGPSVRAVGAPGTLKGTPGLCYIGAVQGAGAGFAPSTFDTTQQTVFDVVADVAEVLYKDAHGKVKIRVTADALDVDEPQISVWDNSLGNVLTITDLRAWFSKDAEFDNSTTKTPAIKFDPAGGSNVDWEIFADETVPAFYFGRNDAQAATRTVRFENLGAGGGVGALFTHDVEIGDGSAVISPNFVLTNSFGSLDQYLNGPSLFMNANYAAADFSIFMQNLDATYELKLNVEGEIRSDKGLFVANFTSMQFQDSLMGSPVALSEVGYASLNTYHQSILGGIDDHLDEFAAALGNTIISGMNVTVTLTAPIRIVFAAGEAIVYGKRVEWASPQLVTLPASSQGWVYVASNGGLVFTTVANTAYDGGAVLAYVETDGSSVTLWRDARRMTAHGADDVLEYTVGDSGHFPDFQTAIDYLDMLSQTSSASTRRRRYRLRVIGDVPTYSGNGITVPATIEGLEIIGSFEYRLEWDGDGPYFYLSDGFSGFSIRQAIFYYTNTGTPAIDNAYVVNANAVTTTGQFLEMDGVYLIPSAGLCYGGTTGLVEATGATFAFLIIKGCFVYGDLALFDGAGGSFDYVYIEQNAVSKGSTGGTPSTTVITIDVGDGSSRVFIRDNYLQNDMGIGQHLEGIKCINSEEVLVAHNVIIGDPAPYDHGIDLGGTENCQIIYNGCLNKLGATSAFMVNAILCDSQSFVCYNAVANGGDSGDASSRTAIEVASTATIGGTFTTVVGNQVQGYRGSNAFGVQVSGAFQTDGARVEANQVFTIGATGIICPTKDGVAIVGNYVGGAGVDSAIESGITAGPGTDYLIVGNHVYCYDDGVDGITLSGAAGTIVEGNIISVYENAASTSIGIDLGGEDGIVVIGNSIEGGETGISGYPTSERCVISNNYLQDQAVEGILLDGALNSVGNNVIYLPGSYGINTTSGADNCTIYGNVVKTPGTIGINLVAGADNNEVIANQASTADAGTGNDLAHNITPP